VRRELRHGFFSKLKTGLGAWCDGVDIVDRKILSGLERYVNLLLTSPQANLWYLRLTTATCDFTAKVSRRCRASDLTQSSAARLAHVRWSGC